MRMRFCCNPGQPLGPTALLLALLLWGNGPAGAQNVGWAPRAVMVQGEYGDFYGTTSQSVNGNGTVFKMTPSGTLSTLHNFNGADGAVPNALIQVTGGSFYGTTQSGGANGYGTLFEMSSTGKLTTLYSFTDGNDGWYPEALTRGQDGNFYGATLFGGSGTAPNTLGPGTIFQITPSGAFTTLYSFTGGSDGATPYTLTQGKDGNFYGMTNAGGANGWGTTFQITPSGTFTSLYSFTDGNDGARPNAGLTLGKDGNFYGTTAAGGANQWGTIFKMTPSGTLTPLYSFTGGADGGGPEAALTQGKDGNFYGTNGSGGANQWGVIFQFKPSGTLTPLYNFTAGSTNIAVPIQAGLALGKDGNFYGATQVFAPYPWPAYGPDPGGTIFQITPSGTFTPLYTFTAASAGWEPSAALTLDPQGNLYGSALFGGETNNGALIKILPDGQHKVLHSFNGSDGAYPNTALTPGKDGNFYGTTGGGGADNSGTVFRVTPSGTFTSLYSFTGANDGASPGGALTLGKDGNFYGTAQNGGAYGSGTIFMITPSGTLTTLYTFTAYNPTTYINADGANPIGTLVQGKDGAFYGGTNYFGGAYGGGTIFKITPSGTFTTLYSFTGGSDGYGPIALTRGTDGAFYGTAQYGGVNYSGSVFQLQPDGTFTTLYSFTGGNDGSTPNALTLGKDGNFYGTTENGGANGGGTVFHVTPSGTLTTLYSFFSGDSSPFAGLTLDKEGNFYGTYSDDQLSNYAGGGIFQITPSGVLTYLWHF